MSHVLEHLIEQMDFLKKIRNNLKNNGIFSLKFQIVNMSQC